MRRLAIYLAVLCLLAFALAIAWVATDWPHYCREMHWCDGQGLL